MAESESISAGTEGTTSRWITPIWSSVRTRCAQVRERSSRRTSSSVWGTVSSIPRARSVRPHKFDEIAGASGYLCIFADPRAEDFPIIARQLAALEGVNGVRAVFFPQSVVREDLEFVHERLGALAWHVPYMYPRLSEDYTLSLLGEIPERPRALLVSPEGRVLHEAEVGTAAELSELRQAVEGVSTPTIGRAAELVGLRRPVGAHDALRPRRPCRPPRTSRARRRLPRRAARSGAVDRDPTHQDEDGKRCRVRNVPTLADRDASWPGPPLPRPSGPTLVRDENEHGTFGWEMRGDSVTAV